MRLPEVSVQIKQETHLAATTECIHCCEGIKFRRLKQVDVRWMEGVTGHVSSNKGRVR